MKGPHHRSSVDRACLRRVTPRATVASLRNGHAMARRPRWGATTKRYQHWCDAHVSECTTLRALARRVPRTARLDALSVAARRLDETHPPPLGRIKRGRVVDGLDRPERVAKAINDVAGIGAHVVVLPILAFAIGGRRRGRLIGGIEVKIYGHLDDSRAIPSQDARHLACRVDVLGDVLKNVRAENGIKAPVFEGEIPGVRRDLDVCAVLEIESDSAQRRAEERTEKTPGSGRDVQHPSHGAEKVGLALHVKHHQPMPGQRPASDAHEVSAPPQNRAESDRQIGQWC